ncbi:hypothetical protein N7513_003482 [Penicillium frequentans]|nr:hypothetical protein N7513_003482 [Penicillium glabrum]
MALPLTQSPTRAMIKARGPRYCRMAGGTVYKSYRALLPYMWPSKSRHLQLVACVCFALTAFQRVVNILTLS